jgi:Sulfotransferase family
MIFDTANARESNRVSVRRADAPVFVVGCPRSGTTVLYHMLLSAGGFAVYRSESNVFNLLVPRFGGMRSRADRKALMDAWLNSLLFRVSGLNSTEITRRVLEECHDGGDFLRIVMGEIARSQGVSRWADCTPEHLLCMKDIKRQIPNAIFIHIIRDGRDVALSYAKQGWAYPLPWDQGKQVSVAGLYWQWMVGTGREAGRSLGVDYREVRFEQLVSNPRETLSDLGKFIDHDLDYERIQQTGIGSVSAPNSSFDVKTGRFDPVARWKTKMTPEEIQDFEALVGDRLKELGYPLAAKSRARSLHAIEMRATYSTMFQTKWWLRTHTSLGKTVKLGRIMVERQDLQQGSL